MARKITHVTVIVRDQEESLNWYAGNLGFEKRMDDSGMGFRWLTIGLPAQPGLEIVLLPPMGEKAHAQIGAQGGIILSSDDCRADVERLRAAGVKVTHEPEQQPWGTQAVIEDPNGNSLVLIEPPAAAK